MKKQQALDWLREHLPIDDKEASDLHRMQHLLFQPSDVFSRHHFEPGHFTASAFVLSPDKQKLLLIYHPYLAIWIQPGGHIEATDETPVASAMRELVEETAVVDVQQLKVIDIDIHEIPANPKKQEPKHCHFDLRFWFHAQSWELSEQPGTLQAQWMELDKINAQTSDLSVQRAVWRYRQRSG